MAHNILVINPGSTSDDIAWNPTKIKMLRPNCRYAANLFWIIC